MSPERKAEIAERLRTLAAWFDMYDEPDVDNDQTQRDLRQFAVEIENLPPAPAERWPRCRCGQPLIIRQPVTNFAGLGEASPWMVSTMQECECVCFFGDTADAALAAYRQAEKETNTPDAGEEK